MFFQIFLWDKEFTAEKVTPRNCLHILDKAKEDFLQVIEKLSNKQEFSLPDTLLVLYCLEALLLLKHVQRPGVVKNFQVKDWEEQSREEEQWFEQYCIIIRPEMLRKRKTVSPNDPFFISST
ncbi:hypothetical protein NDU88_004067 [Pleurodeles waltl]|uniref:Uncharacterized protein n=1 Tax=Pleurodeles waltl TaxID=8319 RepID=A0AAV7W3X1_PLEWA|nr:hypothetical protein NDU88_004067 [Pleurodeles waltl]